MKKIEVVAAIIVFNKKILCVQRNEGKHDYVSLKWEFPGGKVESGETFEQALTREIKEELVTEVIVEKLFLTVEHQYPDFFLTMHSFICSVEHQDITLTEHIDFTWLESQELDRLDWAPADIPIVEKLKR
jgi:8-oxo-dGTP diphosphatase